MTKKAHTLTVISALLGVIVFAQIDTLSASSSVPDTYGLVIGIDHYKTAPVLDGAVNDAKSVAEALRSIGAKKVMEIMDEKATRNNIINAWKEITAEAKKGDTVIFSYAGHGAQAPERIPGNEADGLDEFFVLTNFESDGKNTYERIVDDDLQIWFNKASDLNIVLLADSCHSGTMTRGYKQSKLKYRLLNTSKITNDALPPPTPEEIVVADESKTQLLNVVGLSAVADHELDPEVEIEGKTHGALSWYFAQGLLNGDADADHNGKISAIEMKNYLYEKVKMHNEGQQHPQFQNADARIVAKTSNSNPVAERSLLFSFLSEPQDAEFIRFASAQLQHIKIVDAKTAQLEWNIRKNEVKNNTNGEIYPLSFGTQTTKGFKRATTDDPGLQTMINQVQVIIDKQLPPITTAPKGFPTEAAELVLNITSEFPDVALVNFATTQLKHVKIADSKTAELEWDIRQNVIKNVFNDVVYQLTSPDNASKTKGFKRAALDDPQFQTLVNQVQPVVDKFLLVDVIKKAGDGSLSLSLEPNDKLHKKGEQVRVRVDRIEYPFFTLFNLASDGTVNFLYPSEAADPLRLPLGQTYYTPSISVTPPFGADHLIAITSATALSELHQVLKQVNDTRYDLEKLLQVLQSSLKNTAHQIGIQATFTTE